MKYKVTHTTTYQYGDSVPVSQNLVHLTPRTLPSQACRYHRLVVRPQPVAVTKRTDYFGNPLSMFSINQPHRRMSVTATSKVNVSPLETPPDVPPSWETIRDALPCDRSHTGLDAFQFAFDSPHVATTVEFAKYARESFVAGRDIVEAADDLTERIFREFTYDPKATTVSTPIAEVFTDRRGVCQDLAHLQIGCLRSVGLAARYVSGYLRTHPPEGKARLVGADASHAWLSLYAGPLGWIDLDPTNNLRPSTEHITLAWGRDYSDVCPISGMFVGGGAHTMKVSVDVVPM